jgi:hypothetical protein
MTDQTKYRFAVAAGHIVLLAMVGMVKMAEVLRG